MDTLSKIQKIIASMIIFLLPLFFLTSTQEFFLTNKLYLLFFGILTLITITALQLLQAEKITLRWSSFTTHILIFLCLAIISVMFSSPNKVQAILSVNMGLGMIVSLVILYFYCSTLEIKPLSILFYSAFVLSAITILFFFNPFATTALPAGFQFLKSQHFTPLGSQLDLAIFLGFFSFTSLGALGTMFINKKRESLNPVAIIFAIVIIIGCLFSSINVYDQLKMSTSKENIYRLELPPFNNSYLSAIETLKRPKTAVFGYGIDNFATAFTLSKPVSYNSTSHWDRNFRFSRNGILHIFTEVGLMSAIIFALLLIKALMSLKRADHADHDGDKPIVTMGLIYLCLILLLLPMSFSILFLIFLSLSQVAKIEGKTTLKSFSIQNTRSIGIIGALILCITVISGAYFASRAYASEYAFANSISYLKKNDGQSVYKYEKEAIKLNPYIERYRINFSQLNLLIANNVAQSNKDKKLDGKKRATIAQAIQISIAEGKAVVTLNPQRSSNWENLGNIYRNIINVAKNASTWTISAYQRAIALDPNNPLLRLSLGGVYYSLGNYDEAITLFTQAVSLKPDFANFRYNLAWAYFQNKKYDRAVVEMQNVLSLLKDRDKTQYKKAQEDLEKFKKTIPNQKTATESGIMQSNTSTPPQAPLELPASSGATLDPKINLPDSVQPPVESTATNSAR